MRKKIENTKALEEDILKELNNINKHTFAIIQKINNDGLNDINKIMELVSIAQYVERKGIHMRFMVSQFSSFVNDSIQNNLEEKTDSKAEIPSIGEIISTLK